MRMNAPFLRAFLWMPLTGALLLGGVGGQPVWGQAVQETSLKATTGLPKRLERKFRRDAARLALRFLSEGEDLRYLSIRIPPDQIELFFQMLARIYLQDATAQSIARCNIHTFPDPPIDHLVVIYEKDVPWAEPLRNGINETTNETLNQLLDDFELVIERHVQWSESLNAITIRSREPLNMAALANEFYNIEGISQVNLGVPKISGNDIRMRRLPDGWEVQYILRFGAHISGEGKSHVWTYQALDDGTVRFVSEQGDPIPSWMRCNTTRSALVSDRL